MPLNGENRPASSTGGFLSALAREGSRVRVALVRADGAAYSGRMFSACRPFGPCATSNSTFWFSSSER